MSFNALSERVVKVLTKKRVMLIKVNNGHFNNSVQSEVDKGMTLIRDKLN